MLSRVRLGLAAFLECVQSGLQRAQPPHYLAFTIPKQDIGSDGNQAPNTVAPIHNSNIPLVHIISAQLSRHLTYTAFRAEIMKAVLPSALRLHKLKRWLFPA